MALKIMVVDDEPDALKLFKAMVEPLGCKVLALADSREAVERLESEKFDGILVDVVMPHLDGFELTKRIRSSSLNREVPVVMLTGHDDVDTMRKGFNAGATCFLGKPVSQERLYTLFKAMRGAMLREKRRYTRLPYRTTVKCRLSPYFDKQFISGSQIISEGGMLFGPSGGLDTGQEVELEFGMPDAPRPLRPRARVVYKEPPDRVAVEFIELAIKEREAIQRYISGVVKG